MKRTLTLFILLSMLLINSVSCSGGENAGQTQTEKPDETAQTFETEAATAAETEISSGVEAVDLGGAEFSFLTREKTENYNGYPYPEILVEEENGETLNDAIYARNLVLMEKYNTVFKTSTAAAGDLSGKASKSILAGDADYDVIFPCIKDAFALASSKLVFDLADVPYLDFSRPWWMSGILAGTSVAGRNMFMSGDLNLAAMNTVGITYFNKALVTEYSLETPYTYVENGSWTLDKMRETSQAVTSDLNGDGSFDETDLYGLDCSNFAWQPLFYGTGNLIIAKDSNDIPYLNASSENVVNAITKVISLIDDGTATYNVNHSTGYSDLGALTVQIFREGRALYFIELIYGVPEFRDMEDDFGIVPLPKYDETQEKYSSYLHTGNATATVVPVTNADLDRTGRIIEDMAFESYKTVRPAFYDVMLKTKYARDEKTADMLDIILSNYTLDLTLMVSGIDIDAKLRTAAGKGDTGIMSTIAASESKYSEAINQAVEAISGS